MKPGCGHCSGWGVDSSYQCFMAGVRIFIEVLSEYSRKTYMVCVTYFACVERRELRHDRHTVSLLKDHYSILAEVPREDSGEVKK